MVTIVSAASLVVVAVPLWTVTAGSAAASTVFGLVFPLLLGIVALALGVRTRYALVRLDLAVVLAAFAALAIRVTPLLHSPHYVVDESVLMFRAIAAVAHGRNPYAGDWTAQVARAPTLLLDGTNPGRFGYPPLSAMLGGGLAHVVGTDRAPLVLSTLALVATAALLWRVLPVSRRALLVPATVTMSSLPFLASSGYPTALMVPLLVVACHRASAIGAGGTLGRPGAVRAVALGLAAATQQLAWFVVPFLLVAVWRARRGELDRRRACRVVLRLAGVAAGVFAVVDLPFVIAGPGRWLQGVLDPLRQHAMFDGPGLPNLTLRIVGGGGQLAYWSFAAIVTFLTLLAALALWPRLLGAGLVALPFVALWVSMRSQALYYTSALPLVVAAAGTQLSTPSFASARPVRLSRLPRAAVPVLGGVLVTGLVVAALVTPAPLTLRVTGMSATRDPRTLRSVALRMRNRSDHDVSPHVTVGQGKKFSLFLRQVAGPRTLRPGQVATLVFVPSPIYRVIRNPHEIYVVSDDPQTLSTVRLP